MEEEGVKISQKEQEKLKVNADQEAWIQHRILTAMRMAVHLSKCRRVMADRDSEQYGLKGVAEGTAREIIHTLNMEPEYVNIQNVNDVDLNGINEL